jgi:hypothetical protein
MAKTRARSLAQKAAQTAACDRGSGAAAALEVRAAPPRAPDGPWRAIPGDREAVGSQLPSKSDHTPVTRMAHLKVQDALFFPRILDGGITPLAA